MISAEIKKVVLTNLAVNAAKNEMEVYEAESEALQTPFNAVKFFTVIKEVQATLLLL